MATSTQTPTATRRMDQALTLSAEYARLSSDGRYPEAEQAERTITDLVGGYRGTHVTLPAAVVCAMHGGVIETEARARFFGRLQTLRVRIEVEDGVPVERQVRPWDDVAGHYVVSHSLTPSAARRIIRAIEIQ